MATMLNINKCLAIQNYGTSGTTLLHSLLDNHPQVISVPLILSLEFYRYLVNNPENDLVSYMKYLKDSVPMFQAVAGDPQRLDELGEDGEVSLKCDFNEFEKHFYDLMKDEDNTFKNIFIATYQAYNLCFGNSFKDDVWLCLAIHSLPKKYAEFLVSQFEQVKFIHMIREPIQNAGSLSKHIFGITYRRMVYVSPLRSVVVQIISNNEMMTHFGLPGVSLNGKTPYFPDGKKVESRAVKLEDIHENGKDVMKKISSWLDIYWDDCLLKSTVMSLLWHNRRESIKQTGLSSKGIIGQKHDSYLSDFDKKRFNILLVPEKRHFGYEVYDNDISRLTTALMLFLPFRMEFTKLRIKLQLKFIKTVFKESLKELTKLLLRQSDDNKNLSYRVLRVIVAPVALVRTVYEYISWNIYKLYEFFYIRYIMIRKLFDLDKVNYIKML
jgi:hypothetical protein